MMEFSRPLTVDMDMDMDINIENTSNEQWEGQFKVRGYELSNDTEDLSWKRAVSWILFSSVSIYTNKLLLVQHGFHYPLTVSTFYLVLFSFTSFIASKYKTSVINPDRAVNSFQFARSRIWIWMILASFTSAVSLPLLMEALLHISSLPVIVMCFPIVYLAESISLFIFSSSYRHQKPLSLETLGIAFSTTVILYNEYRLTVPGIICGVVAFMMMGLCRAFLTIALDGVNANEHESPSYYHAYISMTIIFGLLISGFPAFTHEANIVHFRPRWDIVVLFFIASSSAVGTAVSGTSFLVYSPIEISAGKSLPRNLPFPVWRVFVSGSSSALVILTSLMFGPVSVISWVQLNAYCLAILCLVGFSQVHIFWEEISNSIQRHLAHSSDTGSGGVLKKRHTLLLSVSSIALLTFLLNAMSFAQLAGLSPGPSPTIDTTYTSESSAFDIVVSAYTESPESITRMLSAIKSTSYLSSLNPRVIIYTKGPAASLSALQNSTGADIVEQLPNRGREGGTYLHHIVSHWDDLATQTMFIQAHAHNIRELIPRINSYLVPQTGMLSLGFSEGTCSCPNCDDRFGWQDDWSIVPTLYERIYGSACTDSTSLLMSYKGQFVASARRIRGIGRGIYEGLLTTITSEGGWSHDPRLVEANDSPDNPSFGFTVERIWGLLMQCASDERVAMKCPSMLSGMTRGGDVGDCQCLDHLK
ncbi:hypothetical protein DSL72_008598 [Monilinia vaccinii-corymbosi]|uniref:Uncharacterized protein n=1 Tax=Monilinia vaccinii-corymbosi TaxID=61207 RepID=A0A8A3PQS1_9HELO|nr:hypothetical protein DSL72_008598 [Monilinia vaccinii-corymbosi]